MTQNVSSEHIWIIWMNGNHLPFMQTYGIHSVLKPTVLDDQWCGSRTRGSGGLTRLLAQMSQRAADPSGRRSPLGWYEAGRLGAVLSTATQHRSVKDMKEYEALAWHDHNADAAFKTSSVKRFRRRKSFSTLLQSEHYYRLFFYFIHLLWKIGPSAFP